MRRPHEGDASVRVVPERRGRSGFDPVEDRRRTFICDGRVTPADLHREEVAGLLPGKGRLEHVHETKELANA